MHSDAIALRAREEGASGVVAFVSAFTDPAERVQLWSLAQRLLGEAPEGSLDDFIDVVEAGIAEALELSAAAPDEEARRKLVDTANVLAYNLSSGLADCWPADERPRERHHLETGLEAAEACLRWRDELGKGPFPFSIAWWAKGIHLLALGRADEAEEAFQRALDHARQHVASQGGSTALDATGDWLMLLSEGYRLIAHARRSGDAAGFEALLAVLDEAIAARPTEAEDLQFTADQLRCAHRRL